MSATANSDYGAERKFLKNAMTSPLLEQEHEKDLARRWRDEEDEAALHELTSAYVRLVISMATKFRNYGLPMSDLVQEGNVGLMQAAARFDPEREVRFSTYASWWIRSSIQDFVLRNWSIVRTGTTAAQKSLFFNLRRLRARINDVSSAGLTPESRAYIAETLGVSERDVDSMTSRMSGNDKSLNAPVGAEGDAEFQDLLPDEGSTPEELYMDDHDSKKRREWIEEALKVLNPREQVIIMKRRLTDDSVTLEALGDQLGISKERVRQIEHAALNKLRNALTRIVGNPDEAGLTTF